MRNFSPAFFDPLTGCATPELLRDRLEMALHIARRTGSRAAVLAFRMPHGSDAQIVATADFLREATRASDTVARTGPREFAVLLVHMADADGTNRVLQKAARTISTLGLELSYKIAVFPENGLTADELLQHAELL